MPHPVHQLGTGGRAGAWDQEADGPFVVVAETWEQLKCPPLGNSHRTF